MAKEPEKPLTRPAAKDAGNRPCHASGRHPTPSRAITLLAVFTLAILPLSARQTYRFDHLGLDEGLSQTTVVCMAQDSRGFMWFGTQDGLNRYDGYQFKIYRAGKPEGFSVAGINAVVEDGRGYLWIAGQNAGVTVMNLDGNEIVTLDPAALTQDPYHAGHVFDAACYDPKRGVWFGSTAGDLFRFDPVSRNAERYVIPTQGFNNEIRDLQIGRDGTLYVCTIRGLWRLADDEKSFEQVGEVGNKSFNDMQEDSQGRFWLASSQGLLSWQPGEEPRIYTHENTNGALPENRIQTLMLTESGELWLGTMSSGLVVFHPRKESFNHYLPNPTDPYSLSNKRITSLYQDQGGVVWIGTFSSGLNKLNPSGQFFDRYQYVNESFSAEHHLIMDFSEDSHGRVYIATYGGGAMLFHPETGTLEQPDHLKQGPDGIKDGRVISLTNDQQDNLWIGMQTGLSKLDPEGRHIRTYSNDPDNPYSLSDNFIINLLTDRAGRVWIAAGTSGLDLYQEDLDGFINYNHDPSKETALPDNTVNTLFEDREGHLWLGTENGGMARHEGNGRFTTFRHDPSRDDSISSNTVSAIYQAPDGSIWAGTYGNGLNQHLGDNRFRRYSEEDGLPNNAINGLLIDNDGFVWASTNRGLCRLNPEKNSFDVYSVENGLQSPEFNQNAVLVSRKGLFYFGGIRGFNRFDPKVVEKNPFIAPVQLSEVKIISSAGARIVTNSPIRLSPEDFMVTLAFAAMDYTHPRRNQFAYRIDGISDEWIQLGYSHEITFTDPSPGKYSLHVIAANSNGVWNREGTHIPFIVTPPFWKTYWAALVYFLIVALAAQTIYRGRKRRKAQDLERAAATGKAEFATTVLHNIGNVLNSLFVSVDQISRTIENSKSSKLQRGVNLMVENKQELAHFLTENERGRMLPEYLEKCTEQIEKEQIAIQGELEEISHKIELMRDIIETQQTHAARDLPPDLHPLDHIVENALRIQQASLIARKILVNKDIDKPVRVAAHKIQLTHIIINLIKNAAEAMNETPEHQRRLDVSIETESSGQVVLKITDSGCGIEKDHLDKLFSYGFTTKDLGHGFGLYSVARAVSDMGGRIEAESDGAGKGATFILRFPSAGSSD